MSSDSNWLRLTSSASFTAEESGDSFPDKARADLEEELRGDGIQIDRITKHYKTKQVTLQFTKMEDALQYYPNSGKESILLFSDINATRALEPNDIICRKAKLRHFKHCFEVTSKLGWAWHFVTPTALECATWIRLIEQHRRLHSTAAHSGIETYNAQHYWTKAVGSNTGRMSYTEAAALIRRVFGFVSPDIFAARFRANDLCSELSLTFSGFKTFFNSFCDVGAARNLYLKAAKEPEDGMTPEEFTRFMKANSGTEKVSAMRCAELFQTYTSGASGRMSQLSFTIFLLHPQHNSIVAPHHNRCVDPMDFSLHQYFIHSSHNTYLTGDQLTSNSSCLMYRDALQKGCRCLEIDCWDGSDGEPIVYHGFTMTSKILFEDVLRTINEYAFQPTPAQGDGWNPLQFPVIISLEVHTGTEQTERLATLLHLIFGDRLHLPVGEMTAFTPAQLRGKFLIKWKMDAHGDEDVKDTTGSGIRRDRLTRYPPSSLSCCTSIGSIKTTTWGEGANPFNVQSYVETELMKLTAESPLQFARQNMRMLARIYPSGTRINSSNYDPMPAWRLGAQLVALNLQTRDRFLRINEGFFSHQNGGCGYVLKPPHLFVADDGIPDHPFSLKMRFICASHLTQSFNDFNAASVSLRAWIHGDSSFYETPKEPAPAFPYWNCRLELHGTQRDLDVFCLSILAYDAHGDSVEVCTAHIPVRVMQEGYRAIPLRSAKSGHVLTSASVLCFLRIM